jgi:hypothetical protein
MQARSRVCSEKGDTQVGPQKCMESVHSAAPTQVTKPDQQTLLDETGVQSYDRMWYNCHQNRHTVRLSRLTLGTPETLRGRLINSFIFAWMIGNPLRVP